MLCPLSKITNSENTSQFISVKGSNSNRVNDSLIHITKLVSFYDNLLTFRDTGKMFELKEDLLKMMTIKNYIVDLAGSSDEKLLYDLAKETYFDVKASGEKSTRPWSFI